jgi:hypothetical protein
LQADLPWPHGGSESKDGAMVACAGAPRLAPSQAGRDTSGLRHFRNASQPDRVRRAIARISGPILKDCLECAAIVRKQLWH